MTRAPISGTVDADAVTDVSYEGDKNAEIRYANASAVSGGLHVLRSERKIGISYTFANRSFQCNEQPICWPIVQ